MWPRAGERRGHALCDRRRRSWSTCSPIIILMVPLFVMVLLFSAIALAWFVRDQMRRARFRATEPVLLDRAWGDSGVMDLPAEVAGAALDDCVDSGDVKAILVRLLIERKIAADVGPSGLRLRLLVPFSAFTRSAELQLIRALFVQRESIDRPSLIAYYVKRNEPNPHVEVSASDVADVFSGKRFDFADAIEEPVRDEAERALAGATPADHPRAMFADLTPHKAPRPSVRVTSDLVIWLYLVLLPFALERPSEWKSSMGATPMLSGRTAASIAIAAVVHLLSMKLAHRVRRKPTIGFFDVTTMLLPLIAASFVIGLVQPASGPTVLFVLLFAASIANVVLRARFVETAEQTSKRARIRGAVDFLGNAIESGVPIHLSLVPYALAFGMGSRLRAVRDEETVESFRACGGVAKLAALMEIFLRPFPTIPHDD
jgi:hypothetical protein